MQAYILGAIGVNYRRLSNSMWALPTAKLLRAFIGKARRIHSEQLRQLHHSR